MYTASSTQQAQAKLTFDSHTQAVRSNLATSLLIHGTTDHHALHSITTSAESRLFAEAPLVHLLDMRHQRLELHEIQHSFMEVHTYSTRKNGKSFSTPCYVHQACTDQ